MSIPPIKTNPWGDVPIIDKKKSADNSTELVMAINQINVNLSEKVSGKLISEIKENKEVFSEERKKLISEFKALAESLPKNPKELTQEDLKQVSAFKEKVAQFQNKLSIQWRKENPEKAAKTDAALREGLNIFKKTPAKNADLNKL